MDTYAFLTAALRNPVNETIVGELFRLALLDAWIVSSCLVQTAWNVLTGRAVDYGIADYDIFYFDADTSWQAEDTVIRALQDRLAKLDVRIEVRNQARVHLWYPQKHGCPTRRCDPRAKASTAFLPKPPRSGSVARRTVTTSTRRTGLTISPA
jgi:hypothetical protein